MDARNFAGETESKGDLGGLKGVVYRRDTGYPASTSGSKVGAEIPRARDYVILLGATPWTVSSDTGDSAKRSSD